VISTKRKKYLLDQARYWRCSGREQVLLQKQHEAEVPAGFPFPGCFLRLIPVLRTRGLCVITRSKILDAIIKQQF